MDTERKKSKPSRADSPSAARGERRRHPQTTPEGPQAVDDERTASVPLEPAQRHPRHSDDTQAPDEAAPRAWDDRAG